jgi:predicted ArsR family transcriptional regulator
MPISSRKKILIYLQKSQSATAPEIARAMQVTSANVRHHLSGLLADGVVEVIGLRKGAGKGRPVKIFGMSRAALGDNLVLLSDLTLKGWLDAVEEEQRLPVLRILAQRLAGTERTSQANLMRRLAFTVERLNTQNYHARWEAHAAGPLLILGHCPYAAIIDRHPELCQVDTYLLQELLGQPVEQTAKLEKSERGLPYCVFISTK